MKTLAFENEFRKSLISCRQVRVQSVYKCVQNVIYAPYSCTHAASAAAPALARKNTIDIQRPEQLIYYTSASAANNSRRISRIVQPERCAPPSRKKMVHFLAVREVKVPPRFRPVTTTSHIFISEIFGKVNDRELQAPDAINIENRGRGSYSRSTLFLFRAHTVKRIRQSPTFLARVIAYGRTGCTVHSP